jgi:hypothetical protein
MRLLPPSAHWLSSPPSTMVRSTRRSVGDEQPRGVAAVGAAGRRGSTRLHVLHRHTPRRRVAAKGRGRSTPTRRRHSQPKPGWRTAESGCGAEALGRASRVITPARPHPPPRPHRGRLWRSTWRRCMTANIRAPPPTATPRMRTRVMAPASTQPEVGRRRRRGCWAPLTHAVRRLSSRRHRLTSVRGGGDGDCGYGVRRRPQARARARARAPCADDGRRRRGGTPAPGAGGVRGRDARSPPAGAGGGAGAGAGAGRRGWLNVGPSIRKRILRRRA